MSVVVPVAEARRGDAVLGRRGHVVHKPAHAIVVVAEDARIAVPDVMLPRHKHAGRAPFNRPMKRPRKSRARIGRRNRQNAAGGLLRIADIVGDLGKPVAAIVTVAERGRQQVGAFQPTELFPMRTVGHHIGHIGAHRPVDEPMGVVIERTGGPELPDLRQVGAYMHQFQAMNDRRAFRIVWPAGTAPISSIAWKPL